VSNVKKYIEDRSIAHAKTLALRGLYSVNPLLDFSNDTGLTDYQESARVAYGECERERDMMAALKESALSQAVPGTQLDLDL